VPIYERQYIDAFVSGMPIPGLSVEGLAVNGRTSDMVSRRGRTAWTDYISIFSTDFPDDDGVSPTDLGKASFQFQAGMTTLTIRMYAAAKAPASYSGTHTLNIYLDGVLQGSGVLSAGYTTVTVAISGLGLLADQIVEVSCEVTWTVTQGLYRWVDAYVTPLAQSIGTYPGVPTFGDPTLTRLDLLRTTDAWVWDRIRAVDQMALTTVLWWNGVTEPGGYKVLWSGSIAKSNLASILVVSVDYWITTNLDEEIEVVADTAGSGTFSVIDSSGSLTTSEQGTWTTQIDISSWTADAPRYLFVRAHCITKATSGRELGSFFNPAAVFTVEPTPTWLTSPAESTPAESLTYGTAKARLNQIASNLGDITARFTGADAWNRQRCFRQPPIRNDDQRAYLKAKLCARGFRYADYLWVRGKNLSIGWGGFQDNWNLDPAAKPAFVNTKQLTSGDAIQTAHVAFDSLEGLFEGMQYFVTGDEIVYVAEEIA
jgi:hypothetical protein